jgi:hypothetical protein
MNTAILKKILGSVFAVLAGGVFIFSAATKLMPIEAFEISLADIGFFSFNTAPFFARLLIGTEFAIGFLLIFHFRLRSVTIPIAGILIGIFTIYIGYLLKTYGNRGSCGCFGTVVEFTPAEGIAKKFALLAALWVAYKWAPALEFRFKWVVALVAAIVLVVLPYVINPMG